MKNYYEESVTMHRKNRGKIEVQSKIDVNTTDDLSIAYTPGVAAPCEIIKDDPSQAYELTIKGNSV